uniref:Glycosyltransferase n=1 Tax=viral metagenome TaxID=1070528 RepID=A0A6C0KVH6_9ZZZZ
MFLYELACNSGFGDRILDLISILVISRIYGNDICVKWNPGNKFPGFNRTYNTNLFTIDRCHWAKEEDYNKFIDIQSIIGKDKCIWGNYMFQFMSKGIIQNQIFPINTFWGTTSIERIADVLPFYGIQKYDIKDVYNVYYQVTHSIKPCQKIEDILNKKFNIYSIVEPIGIHIRLTDKCVENPDPFTMSRGDYLEILRKCREFVATHRGTYFVCSEDKIARREMQEFILETGNEITGTLENPYGIDSSDGGDALSEDESALLDFFALSRCTLILQCTKYSTFSIAASLINRIPLINFYGYENNALTIWKNTADIRIK